MLPVKSGFELTADESHIRSFQMPIGKRARDDAQVAVQNWACASIYMDCGFGWNVII
jgi:hypothetical protein